MGHTDGPSDNAKFSNDFDIIYVASSCSILVIDRGNQAIREIQLHEDDCSDQYDSEDHLGNLKINFKSSQLFNNLLHLLSVF